MKKWLEKLREIKMVQWALLLIVLGLAISFLFPAQQEKQVSEGGKETASAADALEERIAQVLSEMEGVGRVEVVIWYEPQETQAQSWLFEEETASRGGVPAGAVVVAQGAENMKVRLLLAQAVETLLGLDAQAVEVFAMKQE